jgi:hypothetical protein
MRYAIFGICLGLGLGLPPTPAAAAEECRMALALGLDVSRSVSRSDYAIQRDGLVAAFSDPQVQLAFLSGPGPVALAIYEWGGQTEQTLILDWLLIAEAKDLERASALLARLARPADPRDTGLGAALHFGGMLMGKAPPGCRAHVLDISGDGRNNDGVEPTQVYEHFDFGNLVVNALAVGEHERGLARYFEQSLIRGPGAFVEKAASHADFPAAIRRKLIRELMPQLSALPPKPRARPVGAG